MHSNPYYFVHPQDNCEDDVHINVVVKSNEVQQNEIAKLIDYNAAGSVDQARFLYAATR